MMVDYATGRKLNAGERMLFAATARDEQAGRALRRVRLAPDRARRGCSRRRCRARSSSTRATRCAGGRRRAAAGVRASARAERGEAVGA